MKKNLIVLLLIILWVVGLVYWWGLSSQFDLTADQRQVEKTTSFESSTPYQGQHFSFNLPLDAKEFKNQENLPRAILETYSFDTFNPRVTFSVQVSMLESQDDIPGVTLRRNQQDLYQESNLGIDSSSATVFLKKDGSGEKTAFIKTDDKYYSFSASANQYSPEMEQSFDQFISSLRLKLVPVQLIPINSLF